MSSYLDHETDSDEEKTLAKSTKSIKLVLEEHEIENLKTQALVLKSEGNTKFSESDFEGAIESYTNALSLFKNTEIQVDPIILLNRSASYLALKKYVSALNDANKAAVVDPSNWKAHWRQGLALMAMSQRTFRTKQAIEAFQRCYDCPSLPIEKKRDVERELEKARDRLMQQDAQAPTPDLSNCTPS